MKTIILKHDSLPQEIEFDTEPSTQYLQNIVGGYIQGIQVEYDGKPFMLYFNDDAKRLNLPINLFASKYVWPGASILGNAVLCESTKDLDDEDTKPSPSKRLGSRNSNGKEMK